MTVINYSLIADAESFYSARFHFQKVDVPWIVGDDAYGVTKPSGVRDFATFAGNLVASGEQSFIQMLVDGKLGEKRQVRKYLCTTPCFRDDHIDEYHRQYFLKTELFHALPDDKFLDMHSETMMLIAKQFYQRYLDVETVKTEDGWDLCSMGIELGSYGWREWNGFHWVYGTGCAEPRLSQVIELSRRINA